jgi:excisionase family DNA binding protein
MIQVVEEILNLEEASRYLRIKRRTLYTLAARGGVPAAKIGGQWRFRKSQLDRLFEEEPSRARAGEGTAPVSVEAASPRREAP